MPNDPTLLSKAFVETVGGEQEGERDREGRAGLRCDRHSATFSYSKSYAQLRSIEVSGGPSYAKRLWPSSRHVASTSMGS